MGIYCEVTTDSIKECMRHLHALRIFHLDINPLSIEPHRPFYQLDPMAERIKHLKPKFVKAADKVFKTLASDCPHLTVVCFTVYGWGELVCGELDRDTCFAYLRKNKNDRNTQATTYGYAVEPIEHHMIRHHEPFSDIVYTDAHCGTNLGYNY